MLRIEQIAIPGAFLIEPERIEDERGFFARLWCNREAERQALQTAFRQTNVGWSRQKGTLRGLHFQKAPHGEVKLVRCTKGSIYDVVVDLRPDSSTFRGWAGVALTADDHRSLYVPKGCAQGYLTLTDDVEMYYLTTAEYQPAFAAGVRFDDPHLGIRWPMPIDVISLQDQSWPDLDNLQLSE